MRTKGVIYTVLSAALFGFMPVFADMSYSFGNNPYNMVLFRNLMVLPFLWFLISKGKLSMKLIKYERRGVILVSVLGSALTTILLYQSYVYIGVGTTTTIHFLYPLLVCLNCRLFFGERIPKSRKICLAVCVLGVLCFLDLRNLNNLKGVMMAAGSAVCYSFYITYLGKMGLTRIHPAVYSFYLSSIVSVFMLILNVPMGYLTLNLPWQAYVLMFFVAVGTSLVGSILLNKGVKEIGAVDASIFSLVEPVTSVIAGILVLGEPFGIRNGLGCLLIFGAILGGEIGGRRETRTDAGEVKNI